MPTTEAASSPGSAGGAGRRPTGTPELRGAPATISAPTGAPLPPSSKKPPFTAATAPARPASSGTVATAATVGGVSRSTRTAGEVRSTSTTSPRIGPPRGSGRVVVNSRYDVPVRSGVPRGARSWSSTRPSGGGGVGAAAPRASTPARARASADRRGPTRTPGSVGRPGGPWWDGRSCRGPTPRPLAFSARPGETAGIRTTTSLPLAGRYRHNGEPTDPASVGEPDTPSTTTAMARSRRDGPVLGMGSHDRWDRRPRRHRHLARPIPARGSFREATLWSSSTSPWPSCSASSCCSRWAPSRAPSTSPDTWSRRASRSTTCSSSR